MINKELKNEDYQFLEKQKIIGYTEGLKPKQLSIQQIQVANELLKNLEKNIDLSSEKRQLKDIKKEAKQFFNEYFSLHKIYCPSNKISKFYIDPSDTPKKISKRWNSVLKKKNPFDIPINLINGHSTIGQVEKIIPLVSGFDMSCIENIPFKTILLSTNLTNLSTATYIHEITHTQTECQKGYTNNYHNKEILSIFLEKVSIDHIDPTGKLLRKIELMRFRDLLNNLLLLNQYNAGKIGLSYKEATELSMYIESTLKALKLFDIYQNTIKDKDKRKIIYEIQDIFDRKIQVEDLLNKNNITPNNTTDLTLIRRHIK